MKLAPGMLKWKNEDHVEYAVNKVCCFVVCVRTKQTDAGMNVK